MVCVSGENEGLRNQLKQTHDSNRTLEAELSKYKNDLAVAEEMKCQLLKELSDMSATTESLVSNDEINKYENKIKYYQEELNKFHNDYQAIQEEVRELKGCKEREKSLESSQGELSRIQNKLNDEIRELKRELLNKDNVVQESQSYNTALKSELERKSIENSALNKKLEERTQIIEDLKRDLLNLENKYAISEFSLAETKTSNENLMKKNKELLVQEDRLKHELEQIPALEKALNDFESELRKSKDDLFEARMCKKELQTSKHELEVKLEEALKSLNECIEREELLKIKVEKIPTLESDMRLAEAEARKAKRELEEYLASRDDSDEASGLEINNTLYQGTGDQFNDTPLVPIKDTFNTSSYDLTGVQTVTSHENGMYELQKDLDICKMQLKNAETINDMFVKEMNDIKRERDLMNEQLKDSNRELSEHQEKLAAIEGRFANLSQQLSQSIDTLSHVERELVRTKERLEAEKKNKISLEEKLAENYVTIKQLKHKSDNAVHFEIELGKCREELEKYKSSHLKDLTESKSREEVIKTELALKNQQVELLQKQLNDAQELQRNIVQENLGLLKVVYVFVML